MSPRLVKALDEDLLERLSSQPVRLFVQNPVSHGGIHFEDKLQRLVVIDLDSLHAGIVFPVTLVREILLLESSGCKFTVAVDRGYVNKQTNERETDFISCIAWKQTAQFISRYFSKGKMIAVEGSLRTGSYKDKKHDDVTHYTTDVLVDNVEFCGDKGSGQAEQTPAQNMVQQAQSAGVQTNQMSYGNLSDFEEILSDGDIPF